jgi:preprotein translocase subunit SecD
VQLKELTVQNVSPTLGSDQLAAGIAAGIIGLLLVALYMLVYYRLLGAVVIAGLLVSAALIYALISYLGDAIGLTLTLAGVTGLIVSVGVTVDSYVVYFERLKDEIRTGRTVRASVDRGFTRSFRTIVAADVVSLIGALVLWVIAIGSVRGFAFFLGVATILDLLVAYFFMHPLVSLMARRPHLVRMRGVGIAAGLDAPGVTA